MILASARVEVAEYLSTLIYVYTLLIILYIVVQLLFAVGMRPPYSRTLDAVLGFLRDICASFAASCPHSGGSTSARSWRSSP